MDSSALKMDLIKRISLIDDALLLEEIKRFISISTDENYIFSEEQKETILASLKQYQNGEVLNDEVAENNIKKWLEE